MRVLSFLPTGMRTGGGAVVKWKVIPIRQDHILHPATPFGISLGLHSTLVSPILSLD